MRKFFAAGIAAAVVAFGFATLAPRTALAHSGTVNVSQNCEAWSASVVLANNVTSDRTTVVTSTIPGTTGLTGHYGTSFGTVWDASGPAVAHGTVTLTIYNGQSVEFTTSASLPTPEGCSTPTPSPTPRVTPSPTPKPTPTPTPHFTPTPTPHPTPTPTPKPTPTPSGPPVPVTGAAGL